MGSARSDFSEYQLSQHAQERLSERSKLPAGQLLEMLKRHAYKKIHRTIKKNLSSYEIETYLTEYDIDQVELKRLNILKVKESYSHCVIWSELDNFAITAVVADSSRIVVTILHAQDYSRHDWSDKISDETIEIAKTRAANRMGCISEKVVGLETTQYEVFAHWLDDQHQAKRKILSQVKITSANPLTPSPSELEKQIIESLPSGSYDINFVVRAKKNKGYVIYESAIE